jgi:hypothetical protein
LFYRLPDFSYTEYVYVRKDAKGGEEYVS